MPAKDGELRPVINIGQLALSTTKSARRGSATQVPSNEVVQRLNN
jgi:hypothetical protein